VILTGFGDSFHTKEAVIVLGGLKNVWWFGCFVVCLVFLVRRIFREIFELRFSVFVEVVRCVCFGFLS